MTNLHQSSLDLVKQVLNVWVKKYNAELQKTGDLTTNVGLEGNEIKVLYDNLRKYCREEFNQELALKHPKLSALITCLDDSRLINRNQGSTVVYATLHEIKKIVSYVSNLGVKGLTMSQGKIDELEEVSFAIVYVEPIKQVVSQWTNAFNEAYLRKKENVLVHVKDFQVFYENVNKFSLETKGAVLHELNTNMYAVLEGLNQDRLHAESQKQNYFIMGTKDFEKLTLFYSRYVNPTVIQAEETVSETVEELQAKVEKLKKDLEVERKEHMKTKESMKAEQEELYTTISELTDDLVEVSEKADNLAKVLGYEVFNNHQLQENGGLIGFDTETFIPLPIESACPTGRLKPFNPSMIGSYATYTMPEFKFWNEKPSSGLCDLVNKMGLIRESEAPKDLNIKEGASENKGKDLKLKDKLVKSTLGDSLPHSNVLVTGIPANGKSMKFNTEVIEQMKAQGLLLDFGTSSPDKFETEGKTEQQIGSDILKMYNEMKPEFKKMVNIQMFLTMLYAQTKAQKVADSGFPVFILTENDKPNK